jgi:proteasome assembly chaperone (PAC2) family protein
MCTSLQVKYLLFETDSDRTWIFFSTEFQKNSQIVNFMKIRSMRAEFHVERRTDRQRDMTKLFVFIRNSANEAQTNTCCPQKAFIYLVWILQQIAILYL